MKKLLLTAALLAAFGLSVHAVAQPPEGRGPDDRGERDGRPPRPRGDRDGHPGPPDGRDAPPPNPFMTALDKNHDGIISDAELDDAKASLLTLDRNGDGQLSDEETRPPRPEGPGPRDRGPRDRGPREGGPREGGPREGGPREGGPREGGPRGPMGPPNPERFVEEAMKFDADNDGKLDREELMKFAEEMRSRGPRPPFEGRPGFEGRPPFEGRQGFEGRPPRDGEHAEGRRPDGDRPERPARPASDE